MRVKAAFAKHEQFLGWCGSYQGSEAPGRKPFQRNRICNGTEKAAQPTLRALSTGQMSYAARRIWDCQRRNHISDQSTPGHLGTKTWT